MLPIKEGFQQIGQALYSSVMNGVTNWTKILKLNSNYTNYFRLRFAVFSLERAMAEAGGQLLVTNTGSVLTRFGNGTDC